MKNIFKTGALAVLSLLMITACDPQQSTDYALGAMPTADQLSFTAKPTASKANIIDFANTSSVKGIATWDLSGSKAKGETTQATFPFKGEYTITMTLYTSGGSASITQKVIIANDDMSLLNTPMYTSLTGGAANTNGKTWVFDQYHDGHFGIGEAAASTANWWNAKAEEKTDCSLYTQEFTFTQVGVKFGWKNNGYVYTNATGKTALAAKGYTGFIDRSATAGDFDIAYVPKTNYTFALNETTKTITLSDGAFLGHYAGSSTYQIYSISDDVMYLKCVSTIEPGNGWWYRLIPKEKNIKPNIIIPLKEIALNEDFELATPKVVFAKEDMGSLTNASYSNPAPVPVNTSSKAFLYQKSTGFYSNVFFQATGYKFDLSAQNKITLKVFIPSYNDYTTSNAVAGSWITNAKLKPQVAVKLQDGSLGGNAYTTQTEIIKGDLATDKWIDLTFDFSSVSGRKDYDKIVIQFGAEGQAGSGIFFMDEFHFIK